MVHCPMPSPMITRRFGGVPRHVVGKDERRRSGWGDACWRTLLGGSRVETEERACEHQQHCDVIQVHAVTEDDFLVMRCGILGGHKGLGFKAGGETDWQGDNVLRRDNDSRMADHGSRLWGVFLSPTALLVHRHPGMESLGALRWIAAEIRLLPRGYCIQRAGPVSLWLLLNWHRCRFKRDAGSSEMPVQVRCRAWAIGIPEMTMQEWTGWRFMEPHCYRFVCSSA